MKNVFLINHAASNPNWGDRAASIALADLVLEVGGRLCGTVTEAELSRGGFWDDGTEADASPSNRRIMVRRLLPPILHDRWQRLRSRRHETGALESIPRRWDQYGDTADRWLRDKQPWRRLREGIEQSDLVLIHGDGVIATPSNTAFSLLFIAYVARWVLGKPVAIVNHSLDPADERLQEIVASIYPHLDDVVFREMDSLERHPQYHRARHAPDTAFRFAPARREEWLPIAGRATYHRYWPQECDFDPCQPYVCLGGSSLFYPLSPEASGAVRHGYREMLRLLAEAWGGQVVLVASDLRDQELFAGIATQAGLPLIPVTAPVQQAVDVLGNATAYVGGRWHASIFALRGGAPVVPIASKTFKMEALCRMAGLPEQPVDAFGLGEEAPGLVERLLQVIEQGETLRTRLRHWADRQASGIRENVAAIRCDRPAGG